MGPAMTVSTSTSILAFIGTLFCTICYEWKRSSSVASQDSLRNIYHAEGLWMRCSIPVAGILSCDNYGTTLFDVPGYLQALRAMCVIAALILFCSVVCNMLSLDCVSCVGDRSKAWLARIGGTFSIVAGALLIACVSWYAAEVIREFNYQTALNGNRNEGIKYTFGAALYVGWISGAIAFLGGILGVCVSCCFSKSEEYDGASYSYRPPKSKSNEEYV